MTARLRSILLTVGISATLLLSACALQPYCDDADGDGVAECAASIQEWRQEFGSVAICVAFCREFDADGNCVSWLHDDQVVYERPQCD